MKTKKPYFTAALAAVAMTILILDSKTALSGAAEGIQLCIQTVIPSLFPFFVISILLTGSLTGRRIPFLAPLCRLLRVPSGAESLLAVGLLGGYPVGAQCIAQAQRSGALSASTARRMMAFCSNAGPAFLFGIGAGLFPKAWMCWLLWGIHMVSAWIVGMLIPGSKEDVISLSNPKKVSLPDALRRSVQVMASVCGWVVLFRVLIAFCSRWFLWMLPKTAQILFCGILELANGCIALGDVDTVGLRFTLCALFLSFGGWCVTMQTFSVTAGVDATLYLPGKVTQAAISLLLCMPAQLLISREYRWMSPVPIMIMCLLICGGFYILTRKPQKTSSIPATAGV